MIRAPLWLIGLLLLAAIGVGTYAYYTTPLPFGLSAVIQTPGGTSVLTPTPTESAAATGTGSLTLGAVSIAVQSVAHNQNLTASGGPPGQFSVVDLVVRNTGTQPLTPQPSDFRLVDGQGRAYAVDLEATRSANTAGRHRVLFDATVPPSGSIETMLAFEVPADATALALHVTLGYGDLTLPAIQGQ